MITKTLMDNSKSSIKKNDFLVSILLAMKHDLRFRKKLGSVLYCIVQIIFLSGPVDNFVRL